MKTADNEKLYDIGVLKQNPETLYDLTVLVSALLPYDWDEQSEIYQVFRKLHRSLWGQLPQVVTHDFRDPQDPLTWGEFGCPADCSVSSVLPKLYTMQELADYFLVSKSTVSRWLVRGVLPSVCVGGRHYVRSDDLCTAVQSGVVVRRSKA